jgi:cell division protein FtsA
MPQAQVKHQLFIEFSSSELRGVVSEVGKAARSVARVYSVTTAGIKNGQVSDFAQCCESLQKLITKLEDDGCDDFSSCILAVQPALVRSQFVETKIGLHGVTISEDHKHKLQLSLKQTFFDTSFELVDFHPQSWRLDDVAFEAFPMNHSGQNLVETNFCLLAERAHLAQLVAVCNSQGLTVSSTRSTLLAAKKMVFKFFPNFENAVLLDLGHSSTSGVLCVGGRLNSFFSVRAGSAHVTRDVATGLNLAVDDAEHLKKLLGLRIVAKESILSLPSGAEKSNRDDRVSEISTIYPWAAPRVAELFNLSLRHFALYAKALDGGLILIGGGSQLPDLNPFLSSRLHGVKATRFKPTSEALGQALGITISAPSSKSLSGWEGLLGMAAEWTIEQQSMLTSRKLSSSKMLRPILSWFLDLSK